MKKILNILNGQCMCDHFFETGLLKSETFVLFNEAMCVGEVMEEIFSHEFFLKRCTAHNVSFDDYKEKTIDKLVPLLENRFSDINLWFGGDMFCQINLLTVLAYLEQRGFKGSAVFVLVNENKQFEIINETHIELGKYYEIYKSVLIKKIMPRNVLPSVLNAGIRLYLNLCEKDNEIIKYIKEHKDTEVKKLVSDLMCAFPEYGLGDVQYFELIKRSI